MKIKTDKISLARVIRDYALMTLGTLMTSAGVYFFKFPNNFTTGGVTGISVVLSSFTDNVTPSSFVFIINIALLIVGFAFLGRSFGIRTVYCSLLLSGSLKVLEWLFPMTAPLTDQPLLELVWSVILPGVGSAILFNLRASTGGTDIVAMILKKFTALDIGKALFVTDFIVVVAACLIFDIRTGLLSMLGLLSKALVVDNVIESINQHKYFLIVTNKPAEVCDYINTHLHRGATEWTSKGAYTHSENHVILVVMSRGEANLLRKFVKKTDPHAFIVISNTSDIIGKGFRDVNNMAET